MKKIIVSIPNALLAGGVVMYLKKNPNFKVYREDNPVSYTHLGTGGGNYAEGDIVTITANEPATGKEFDKWIAVGLSGDGDYEFELNTFSFIMPANDVAFTATYKAVSYTHLDVYKRQKGY